MWLPRNEVKDLAALDVWLRDNAPEELVEEDDGVAGATLHPEEMLDFSRASLNDPAHRIVLDDGVHFGEKGRV